MSITTELRKYASSLAMRAGASTYEVKVALEEIADQIEEEMANYIPLPKDADGETIRVGDELEFRNGDRTMRGTVQALSDCWVVFGEGPYYGVKSCHHVQPDSWERIISEFAERVLRSGHQWGLDAPAATAEFVERCKRLAGEDA